MEQEQKSRGPSWPIASASILITGWPLMKRRLVSTSFLNHSVNRVPSVLDCSSQEIRPGCHHQLGDRGRLASPGGRCVTEPLSYCHPERSAPPSSGSGLCLRARSGGGEAQKGWTQICLVYTVSDQSQASHCLLVSGCPGTKMLWFTWHHNLSVYLSLNY